MEGIPTSPLRRGTTLFRLSPAALGIQELVRFRCLVCPPATSTPLLALRRLILTKGIQIRALAQQRFCLTPSAEKTRPMEQPRLNLTTPATTTRPTVLLRSLETPKAWTTQPLVMLRSIETPPATTTPPTGRSRSLATTPATRTRPTVLR